MQRLTKIFVAGHRGMVGTAISRLLLRQPQTEIVTRDRESLDLTCQKSVDQFFESEEIDQVYLAAAKVGGIYANNSFPAEFIYENLMIEANVIHASFLRGVKKLLFLGSSCIYPKLSSQPMSEAALLSGKLEPTNEPYAVAKIAGIKLCESYNRQYGDSHGVDFRSVMPTNLYGPGDNYHPDHSHVIPGLIRRFHDAKEAGADSVTVWGSGNARREFLHVDDMARACLHVMNLDKNDYRQETEPTCSHINVGYGSDVTIKDLAERVSQVVGFGAKILFDPGKPDGAPRKLMDSSRLRGLGWSPKIDLEQGLVGAYDDFKSGARG
ncbi:MAG: GDP-L-fucose synthase [Pseudomonadota bacterium]